MISKHLLRNITSIAQQAAKAAKAAHHFVQFVPIDGDIVNKPFFANWLGNSR
ncbi:MAG: hypothetical protein R3E39_02275 [Anaerolineae bacterium]